MEHGPVQILTFVKVTRMSLHVMEPELYGHVHKTLSMNLMSRFFTLSV